ncbi:MAG TPA: hypothetical protein DDW55_03245 [Gammaproteobacteria bacterium]|nr:hypothetical protein [Gammaproteobacteria bacterium]
MQTGKRIRLACLLTLALLLPAQAYALGVGKLIVNSALDEPLNASIELSSATVTELKTLNARLAVRGVFQQAGIEYTDSLAQINFAIDQNPAGKSYIRLTTEQPFRDPFMHFVLEVTWGGGQMYREYTALLDPPSFTPAPTAQISAPVVDRRPVRQPTAVSSTVPDAPPPIAAPETASAKPLPTPTESATSKLGPSTSGSGDIVPVETGEQVYGPVRSGDVLWSISERYQGNSGNSVQQVMMAIFHANPQAFQNNNINYLKAGQTLRIPSGDVVAQRSKAEARSEMRAQMQQWEDYKSGAAATASTVEAPDDIPQDTADQSVEAVRPEPDAAVTDTSAEDDQEATLKIVRSRYEESAQTTTEEAVAVAGSQTEAEIAEIGDAEQVDMQESLATARMEKQELEDRVALLEAQIEKANKLINMQNEDLARLQTNVDQDSEPAQAVEPVAVDVSAEPAAVVVEEVEAIEEVAVVAEPEPAPVIEPVAKSAPKKERVARKAPPRSKSEPEQGFFGSIIEAFTGSMTGIIGGILLIVLAIVGLFVMMRRRRSISEFEDSIISGTAVLDISTAESAQPTETASETSFLSDFVPGMANAQADEVDPLAEAEVYMAYGRDEQAEDVLKKAVEANPDRHELKVKLLEIYKTRNDVTSFETLAEELYSAGDATSVDVWNQVSEMGRELNPVNPLYAEGGKPSADAAVEGIYDKKERQDKNLEDLLGTQDDEHTEEIDVTEDVTEEVPEPDEDVLDMDMGEFEPDDATSASDDSGIDFNMDGIDLDLGTGDEATGNEEGSHDDTLEFADLDDLTLADVSPDAANETPVEEWDECTTKLDLARAYIEMDDAESATSILNEVTVEGTDEQKKEARELLSQINA